MGKQYGPRPYPERSDLNHYGGRDSRCRAWLHECQSNRKDNCEDNQEYIKRRLTLSTPTNCEENSEEDTQTSQHHLKVNVHFIVYKDLNLFRFYKKV